MRQATAVLVLSCLLASCGPAELPRTAYSVPGWEHRFSTIRSMLVVVDGCVGINEVGGRNDKVWFDYISVADSRTGASAIARASIRNLPYKGYDTRGPVTPSICAMGGSQPLVVSEARGGEQSTRQAPFENSDVGELPQEQYVALVAALGQIPQATRGTPPATLNLTSADRNALSALVADFNADAVLLLGLDGVIFSKGLQTGQFVLNALFPAASPAAPMYSDHATHAFAALIDSRGETVDLLWTNGVLLKLDPQWSDEYTNSWVQVVLMELPVMEAVRAR